MTGSMQCAIHGAHRRMVKPQTAGAPRDGIGLPVRPGRCDQACGAQRIADAPCAQELALHRQAGQLLQDITLAQAGGKLQGVDEQRSVEAGPRALKRDMLRAQVAMPMTHMPGSQAAGDQGGQSILRGMQADVDLVDQIGRLAVRCLPQCFEGGSLAGRSACEHLIKG